MAEKIASRDNDRVKYARRLAASGAFRAEENMFFAEGKKLCFDLAQSVAPQQVFCTEAFLEACPAAEKLGRMFWLVSDSVAQKLSDTKTPQGLFCLFPTPQAHRESLRFEAGVLVCERLQDPANVGAVLRSAAAFGYGGVVLLNCADPYGPKALRASMGAVGRLPVVRAASVEEVLEDFERNRATVYAAAPGPDSRAPEALPTNEPFVLLVGNEGAGLSETALQNADARVGIPMENGVESLNAAVAASVLMYEMKRPCGAPKV